MIEVTGDDSEPYVFKTEHGVITVTIIKGRLHVSCGLRSLVILPSSGNAIYVHECHTDRDWRLYEPEQK
jgi:hypothetical protein